MRLYKIRILVCILCVLAFSGCYYKPHSEAYQRLYSHLDGHKPKKKNIIASDFYLILLVNARHLDYSDGKRLLKTIRKHPSDGSKNGDVGHAWILLKGVVNGKPWMIEGGHSGELGQFQPRYFDGIMDRIESGDANPVGYLWEVQRDGFFQMGSGGHRPSYAIKVDLTEKQFLAILSFIDPRHYDYPNYALFGNQCATFVAAVAKIVHLDLNCEVTIPIPQSLSMGQKTFYLWSDPSYSQLTLSSPDILEQSMMQAVEEERVEYALPFYLKSKRATCILLPNYF